MAVLQSTNVQGTLCVNGVAVGGGKDFKYCCFTASSTFTPSQDLVDGDGAVNLTMVGGGGGGGLVYVESTGTGTQPSGTACGTYGGGAGMGQYIQTITATDACTVTVGAGGDATPTITGRQYILNGEPSSEICNRLTSSAEGGNTTFGDYTEYGGGGGKGIRSVTGPGYQCTVTSNSTRNGTEWDSGYGGGAADNSTYGAGYSHVSEGPGGENLTCNIGFTMPYLSRCCNWGSANTTSSFYSFYPNHEKLRAAYVFCGTGGDFSACDFYEGGTGLSNTLYQPWIQNNGVKIDGGKVVGTNKLSIFENGINCETYLCCNPNSVNSVCITGSGPLNAINCGGGAGGPARIQTAQFCNVPSAGTQLQSGTGKGGDGLVILKWFE